MKPTTVCALPPSRSAIRRAARSKLPVALSLLVLRDFDDTRPSPHWACNDDDLTRFAVSALLVTSRQYFCLPERRR